MDDEDEVKPQQQNMQEEMEMNKKHLRRNKDFKEYDAKEKAKKMQGRGKRKVNFERKLW